MATKGDVRELRGIKFIVLTGPRDKRHDTLHRATRERHQHGWRQKTGGGLMDTGYYCLYWGFWRQRQGEQWRWHCELF